RDSASRFRTDWLFCTEARRTLVGKNRSPLKPSCSLEIPEMPKTRLTATDARKTFSETLLRVFKGERIVLQRHGRDLAALIPMEDCTWLEELEDLVDLAAARTALAEGG